MNYSFTDYEAAVLWALEGLRAPVGPLAVLEGFAGQIKAAEFGLEVSLRGMPAVLVEVEGADLDYHALPYYTETVRINLYVAARSWREQEGARGESGVYGLLSSLRGLLLANTLSLTIRSTGLELIKEDKVAGDQAQVIYVAQYRLHNDRVIAG
jgi:hypothetical protein